MHPGERPPSWAARARQALDAYNWCGRRTSAHREKPISLKPSIKNVERFWSLVLFCHSLDVKPLAWIYGQHAVRQWRWNVKVDDLFSESFVARYRDLEGINLEGGSMIRIYLGSRRGPVPGRDLIPSAEQVKALYQQTGRSELCWSSGDVTFGFHPLSVVCPSCPLVDACRAAPVSL